MTVGVLALQGDFQAHGAVLDAMGASWREVRGAEEMRGLTGLLIPGGESTTLLKLLTPEGRAAILDLAARGGAIYGTCAGAVLLARTVFNPSQPGLGLLDADVARNGYGRQKESFVLRPGDPGVEGDEVPEEMVFIRAPRIRRVGPGIQVLVRVKGDPVYVMQENILVTTFHPELTKDRSVHARFLSLAGEKHAIFSTAAP